MSELNDQDRGLINDLCNVAWQSGAVKSPQMAQAIEMLRMKLQKPKPTEAPALEKVKGGKAANG